ncbi:MAG: flagellar M-ring protein FliF [Ignavibacteriaceae bacterium]|nr:flagellar M-ring protein FliF [Ignavibacteriaceae bacterium]
MNKNPLEAVFSIFNKLTMQQKMLIGGVVALTVAILGVLMLFLNEPNYTVLYSNLAEEDASKVVDQLNNEKVPFKLDDNGRTIKVPKEKVYEVRLSLAGKGIPSSGVLGYELFDKSSMGMSEFMQKLNYKRALEGELSRTIMQQNGVEGVRVHLVFPEKSVFKDEQKPPTASVVLKLKNGLTLSKSNVSAIVNLISSSVEGLAPEKVSLLDTRGRLLSKENNEDPLAVSSSKQYEIKQSVEEYLVQKAQRIMDNVVGYGNSIIQVNAELNFDQVEKTMETYDPDSQVAVSEQSTKSENAGRTSSDSTAQTTEVSTTNYEISKTVQRVVEGTGTIKKLSVAAVINDVGKEVKKGNVIETVFEPRPADQMKKLEEIIRNAVGINGERNDQFSLVNISFETKPLDEFIIEEPTFLDNMGEYINLFLIIIAIGASIFLLKGLMHKLKNERIIIGTFNSQDDFAFEPAAPSGQINDKQKPLIAPQRKRTALPLGDIEDEISDEAVLKLNQQEKITNYVSKNPMEAAKLINAWLHEDEI